MTRESVSGAHAMSIFKWFEIDSLATAYELQSNCTTYSTVFNSWAAQMIKFEPRM